jgi:hypothetical protein
VLILFSWVDKHEEEGNQQHQHQAKRAPAWYGVPAGRPGRGCGRGKCVRFAADAALRCCPATGVCGVAGKRAIAVWRTPLRLPTTDCWPM